MGIHFLVSRRHRLKCLLIVRLSLGLLTASNERLRAAGHRKQPCDANLSFDRFRESRAGAKMTMSSLRQGIRAGIKCSSQLFFLGLCKRWPNLSECRELFHAAYISRANIHIAIPRLIFLPYIMVISHA